MYHKAGWPPSPLQPEAWGRKTYWPAALLGSSAGVQRWRRNRWAAQWRVLQTPPTTRSQKLKRILGLNVIIWDEMLSSGMQCYPLELMLSSGANVIIWDEMLLSLLKCYHLELMFSSGTKCYHLGCNLELMLSSGTNCYYLGWNVIIWVAKLSSGANFIIWDEMLSSEMKCYHLGCNVIIWS